MRQRGIADGWLYLIGVVVVLGLIYGIFQAVTGYLEDVDANGYKRGVKETKADYAERDNEALRKAAARIKELEDQARAQERAHAKELARIEAQRAKEKADAQKQQDNDRAAIDSGALELHDPDAAACPAPGGGGAQASVGAGAGVRDAKAGRKLSPAAARVLLALANEADDVARQLASAQQVIEEQIRTCNTP